MLSIVSPLSFILSVKKYYTAYYFFKKAVIINFTIKDFGAITLVENFRTGE